MGYEIQILESTFTKLKTNQISDKNIVFWLKHIKKEDSDLLFGFKSKDQKDFFSEILNVKGIGAQIGMSLLNKFSINEIIEAINKKDKKLISSVQGIGQKMTERIILELKSNLCTKLINQDDIKKNYFSENNNELTKIFEDLEITLQSLKYPRREIKNVIPILIKDIENEHTATQNDKKISFETLLRKAMNYLDKNNSNLGQ